MLPTDILDRLLALPSSGTQHGVVASTVATTVGFIDLVQFTETTADMRPREMVEFSIIFNHFRLRARARALAHSHASTHFR
jgi:class 3 adenylate cyclase